MKASVDNQGNTFKGGAVLQGAHTRNGLFQKTRQKLSTQRMGRKKKCLFRPTSPEIHVLSSNQKKNGPFPKYRKYVSIYQELSKYVCLQKKFR